MNEESLSLHIEFDPRYRISLYRKSCGDSCLGDGDGDGDGDHSTTDVYAVYGTRLEYLSPIY